ncbi:hypothetical protein SprV_0301272400 [Sparganum proliferum]
MPASGQDALPKGECRLLTESLDDVLVRQEVTVTKVIYCTDHRFFIYKIKLRLQPHRKPQSRRSPGKLNTAFLSFPAHRLHFSYQLTQRLGDLPAADENASMQARWFQLRDVAHSTVLGGLGRARRQHQIWFDGKYAVVSKLLAENRLHRTYLERPTDANKAAFYQCRRLAQPRFREMQDAWVARKV